MRNLRSLFVSFCLALIFVGCATFEKHENSAKLVTQYAVMKFAEQSSPERRDERIANVKRIAEGVKALATNQEVSIEGLQSVVGAQIAKLGLSPADSFLAMALVQMVAEELKARVGDGVLSADAKLQVAEVMDWVIGATAFVPKVGP